MTIIRRTVPRADLSTFRGAFDRLFDEAVFRPSTWGNFAESRLPLDITSTEDAVTIEAALPGVRPEDVEDHGPPGHADDRCQGTGRAREP